MTGWVLLWCLGMGLAAFLLPWWERRSFRELAPLCFALLLGALLGAGLGVAWGKARWAVLTNGGVPGNVFGASLFLGFLTTLVLTLLARWPAVETPLDVVWLALALNAGMGVGLFGVGALGQTKVDFWLLVSFPPLGAGAGAVWGGSLSFHRLWVRLALLVGAVLVAGLAAAVTVLAGRYAPAPWLGWATALWWVLLGVAVGQRSDEKLIRPQLVEEAGFGLLPPQAVEAGSRFLRRCGGALARRWDERKALAWLLVRLAACKAYLGRQGKKQSAAAVELGRLRERARRIFGGAGGGVQSQRLA